MVKLISIVGARPQFIKAAALSREISKYNELDEMIVHTGQHFDANMSDVFFEEMQIPKPHFHLNINGLNHGAMTGKMLQGIEDILINVKPDAVVVYGDTNSTLAGALAARKLQIKVVHVEAGLRSFNMKMPEEVNRILTDRISDVLFCPTQRSIQNLSIEGFDNYNCKIINTGDIMQDSALFYQKIARSTSTILDKLNLASNKFVLATIHRAENTDNIENLIQIILALNKMHEECEVILPLHPRTKKLIEENNIKLNFKAIEPISYFDMIQLISNARLVCTDSGGLQKEAYFFDKYCITFRQETEWVELVDGNYNELVGTNQDRIWDSFLKFKDKPFVKISELYGAGKAAEVMALELLKM
jgi:UDP-GlcNAc3NAcA epimerase